MSGGYTGRVLWVDLSAAGDERFESKKIADEVYRQFGIGYGLAARLIWDRQPGGLGPFDPGNVLAFMSGLLTNGRAVFNGRWMVAGKSPLTGTWGDANCGGNFAPAIKRTGYDGILFIGKSDRPVYLLVDGKNVSLEDASDLWGKRDAVKTEKELLSRHGEDFRVACIGSGGENQSLISGIVNDSGRLAGRSGLGALMGSKHLKAVCLRGYLADDQIPVTDQEGVQHATSEYLSDLADQLGEFYYLLHEGGTAATVTRSGESGDSPLRNWLGVASREFPIERAERLSGSSVIKYQVERYGCYSCPIQCGGICTIPGSPLLARTHRPEYDTICAFGTQLLSDDLEAIFEINERLNRAGIDTISCGTALHWAFEAFEKGVITSSDTDGLNLTWGNADAAVELVKKIIAAEGIGNILRDGVMRAANHFGKGSEAFAMHAGGQELPMHDCRNSADGKDAVSGGLGLGVAYEVEPTPGRHTSWCAEWGSFVDSDDAPNLLSTPHHTYSNRYYETGESRESRGYQLMAGSCTMDLVNVLGLCVFGLNVGIPVPLVEWANKTTGWTVTGTPDGDPLRFDDYLEIGRRVKTLRHCFNLRENPEREKDRMPDRARGIPPLQLGPNTGSPKSQQWDDAEDDYFKAIGWDRLSETLDELGLSDVREELFGK